MAVAVDQHDRPRERGGLAPELRQEVGEAARSCRRPRKRRELVKWVCLLQDHDRAAISGPGVIESLAQPRGGRLVAVGVLLVAGDVPSAVWGVAGAVGVASD